MSTTTTRETTPTAAPADARALKIMAKSVYRELKTSGYGHNDVVAFASTLLELVTSDLRDDGAPSPD
jgi:hypothetical protein